MTTCNAYRLICTLHSHPDVDTAASQLTARAQGPTGYQQQPPPPRPFSMLSHKVGKPTSRASYCGPRIVHPNPASAKQPFLPATTTSAWGHSH
ncbi:hypothetical protein HaLaN_11025 [Haematococcus lacustris]|uniref:Uncharacterized protein n=1 Tax=Haematococcus lacustris TaxID=44745 RepID=A0A699YZ00_HAELA|nr:hypothetical protein HaLaN_11025 [Haematococcus lacustris]